MQKYKECLENDERFDVANRYDCDMMNNTYNQHKFRAQCWNDQGIFLADDSYCSEAKDLIQKRFECYVGIDGSPDDQSNINSLGYCETSVILNSIS